MNIRTLFLITTMAAITTVYLFSIVPWSHGLTVSILDVGQGDAIFIETITGKQVLIDAGRSPYFLNQLSEALLFFDKHIDIVVATHPDLDHIGGLTSLLRNRKVEYVIDSGYVHTSLAYMSYQEARNTSKIIYGSIGQTIMIDPYTTMEILAPPKGLSVDDANSHSVVVRISYGSNSILLPGDIGTKQEQELVHFYKLHLASDILKLAHHGSRTSSSLLFLETVAPDIGIVSAGCDNDYGHPHDDVVDRVVSLGISIYTTCDEGTIRFFSDGNTWKKL
jgi:competence protein ComEC